MYTCTESNCLGTYVHSESIKFITKTGGADESENRKTQRGKASQ